MIDALKAKIAALKATIADLTDWNDTQAESMKALWVQISDLTTERYRLRKRVETQQRMIDWQRKRIETLECPVARANEYFKEQGDG